MYVCARAKCCSTDCPCSRGFMSRGAGTNAGALPILVLRCRRWSLIDCCVQSVTSFSPGGGALKSNIPVSYSSYVTISGLNFGNTAAYLTPTASFGSSTGTICGSTSWTSTSTVQCQLTQPAYNYYTAATGNYIVVKTAGGTSATDTNSALTFDAPVVSYYLSYNFPTSGGTSLTLTGRSFSPVNTSPTAYIGSTMCATSQWVSDTQIMCAVRTLEGGTQSLSSAVPSVRVRIRAVFGTKTGQPFSFDAPVITSTTPRYNFAASGGYSVTLRGFNFGSPYQSSTVVLHKDTHSAGLSCSSIWISSSSIQCRPNPALAPAAGSPVVVTVAAIVGTRKIGFTFDTPVISVSGYNGNQQIQNLPVSGGTLLTIAGLNFGNTDFTPTAAIGDDYERDNCATTAWTTYSAVLCESSGATYSGPKRSALLTVAAVVGTRAQLFSFDAPLVSNIISGHSNRGFSNSISVTIAGLNFGYKIATPTAFFMANSACPTTAWTSASTVSCQSEAVTYKSSVPLLKVDVATIIGTAPELFTFDAPVVSYDVTGEAAKRNLAMSGGSSVTVTGLNFASANPSATAMVKGQMCSCSQWASATTILCRSVARKIAGGGYTGDVSVVVSISAVVGTRSGAALTFDAPVFTSYYLYNTAQTGGSFVTLDGANFGNNDFTPTAGARLDNMCSTTSWSTASSIVCQPSANTVGFGAAATSVKYYGTVTVSAIVGTRKHGFSYDSPTLSHANQANAATSGSTSVTISGLNFGYNAYTPTAQLDEDFCATTSWTSASTIECASSDHIDGKNAAGKQPGSVVLTVSATVGTRTSFFTFDAPAVSNLLGSDNAVASGGTSVTISGLNFGKSYSQTPTAHLSDSTIGTTSWTSATTVQFLNAATGANAYTQHWGAIGMGLTVGSQIGTAGGLFTFDAPVVSASLARNAASSGSASLTIFGMNFAQNYASPTVRAGATLCVSNTWVSNSIVRCLTPVGYGPKKSLQITIAATVGTRTLGFSFDAPIMTHSLPFNQASTSAVSVSLIGSNFGNVDSTPTAGFGNPHGTPSLCPSTAWVSQTQVLCTGIVGTGSKQNFVVTVSAVVGTRSGFRFTYDAPASSRLTRANMPNTASGTLTLHGINFGPNDATPTATLGDDPVLGTCITTTWTTDSLVKCGTPPNGDPGRTAVIMTVSAVVGTSNTFFSFDAPAVSNRLGGLGGGNFGLSNGLSVTISGLNFGATYATPTLAFVSEVCATTAWTSGTTVACHFTSDVPTLTSFKKQSVKLTVNSVVSTQVGVFTFDAPVVSFNYPVYNGPGSGMNEKARLTLSGMNFANENLTPTVRISATSCATTTWLTQTALQCLTPPGINGNSPHQLFVSVGAIVGTSKQGFSFDSPVLSWTGQYNILTASSGYTLTVEGMNFGYTGSTPTVSIEAALPVGGSSVFMCATSSWSTSTTILCHAPTNTAGGMKTPVVTVGAVVGTRRNSLTYDAPIVSFLDKPNTPHTSGATLTLLGLNFGSNDLTPMGGFDSDANAGHSGTSAYCATTAWSTYSAVTCKVAVPTLNKVRGVGTKDFVLTVSDQVGAAALIAGALIIMS